MPDLSPTCTMTASDAGQAASANDPTASVNRALAALQAGTPVVVADDPERENEIDFVVAATAVSADTAAMLVRHGSGLICAAMPAQRAHDLLLPPQTPINRDPRGTAYTVLCDAARWPDDGQIHTGISASDRAATLRVLADPRTTSDDLVRPGHVAPLAAVPGGVLERAGHTEAGVDLTERTQQSGVAAIVEIQHDSGAMVRLGDWAQFRRRHRLPDLPVITIADLIDYRRRHEVQVTQVAMAQLPTRWGAAAVSVWRDLVTGEHHVAVVTGDVTDSQPVLTRVHSECLTGDVLGSLRCDCGAQRDAALDRIGREGRGVLVYVAGHEGRGIGLAEKVRAYALQDLGADTVEANLALGLPVDARRYHVPGQILAALGVGRIRLLTNNPAKAADLAGHVRLACVEPLTTPANPHNLRYLQTKATRLGHDPLHLATSVAASAAAAEADTRVPL
jgi:3,4-dihydroxy 2-butanone 4-phosphate synthase / GTP cyclohydrolase II